MHRRQASLELLGVLKVRCIEARGLRVPAELANDQTALSLSTSPKGGSASQNALSHLPFLQVRYDAESAVVNARGGSYEHPIYQTLVPFDVSCLDTIQICAAVRDQDGDAVPLAMSALAVQLYDGQTIDHWFLAEDGEGEFHLQLTFEETKKRRGPITIDDFELLKVIGKGSFGKVMQVRKRDTGRIYALKSLRKSRVVENDEVIHTLAERAALATTRSPFIVPLKMAFQTPDKLYLVLSYVNGGELFHHLQRSGRFSEDRARFYAAELLSALDHLHSLDIIYRDLKPENILIDHHGHLKLTDFGLAKLEMGPRDQTDTFAGTPEYLAPELILGESYTRAVDWWTLGILLAEMLAGLPPWYDADHNKMYDQIVNSPLSLHPKHIRGAARELLTALLRKTPHERLGWAGAHELREHSFFAPIDWHKLERQQVTPPWKPIVDSASDTSNIDASFLAESTVDSVIDDSVLSQSAQAHFDGFSWTPTGLAESVQ